MIQSTSSHFKFLSQGSCPFILLKSCQNDSVKSDFKRIILRDISSCNHFHTHCEPNMARGPQLKYTGSEQRQREADSRSELHGDLQVMPLPGHR